MMEKSCENIAENEANRRFTHNTDDVDKITVITVDCRINISCCCYCENTWLGRRTKLLSSVEGWQEAEADDWYRFFVRFYKFQVFYAASPLVIVHARTQYQSDQLMISCRRMENIHFHRIFIIVMSLVLTRTKHASKWMNEQIDCSHRTRTLTNVNGKWKQSFIDGGNENRNLLILFVNAFGLDTFLSLFSRHEIKIYHI